MKKNIVVGLVLTALTLGTLFAQESAPVNESISASFDKTFQGASNVRWEACSKGIQLAKFQYMGKVWLAYFDNAGEVITSGRKVNTIEELPVQVQTGLLNAKRKQEGKYGTLTLGIIFEMISDGSTSYYVPMENSSAKLFYEISSNGGVALQSKGKGTGQANSSKNLLAKKN